MSHYRYILEGDEAKKKKPRNQTAKTEAEARGKIAKQHPGSKITSFEEIPKTAAKVKPAPAKLPAIKAQAAKPAASKPQAAKAGPAKASSPTKVVLSKLKNMLFLQHGTCFFCGEILSEKDASIEHLYPLSKGGKRSEDNEVVCHKSLNGTFGNMDLKRKFEFTLKAAGSFKCPK